MKTPFIVEDSGIIRRFESRAAAACEYPVTAGQIKDRIRLGWTNRQAVGLDPPPDRPQPPNTETIVIAVKGKEMVFHGYRQLAEYFKKHEGRIRAAIKRGWPIEAAVGLIEPPPRPPAHNAERIVVQDGDQRRVFHGYSALGKHFGKNPDTIRHRIEAGQSPEAAVGLAPPENKRAVTVHTKDGPLHFRSLKAACTQFGKVYETVYDRHHRAGWTLEQALDLEPHPKHTKRSFGIVYLLIHRHSGMKYVGQTVTTLARRWAGHCNDAAREPSKNESLVSNLIRRDGPHSFQSEILGTANNQHELDTLEQHFIAEHNTIAPHGLNKSRGGGGCSAASGRKVKVAGETFPSESAAARYHNVNPATFRLRLKAGKTPEQAAGLVALGCPTTKAKPICFRHRGKAYSYKSRTSAAKAWSISETCVTYRLDVLGWSPRRALTTPSDSNRNNRHKIAFRTNRHDYRYDSIAAAATAWGITYATAKSRLRKGWSHRRTFTTPATRATEAPSDVRRRKNRLRLNDTLARASP
jgi:hypothetical protein